MMGPSIGMLCLVVLVCVIIYEFRRPKPSITIEIDGELKTVPMPSCRLTDPESLERKYPTAPK